MSKTESTMLALGTKAPHFKLLDVTSGNFIQFDYSPDYNASVIMFICNHCPYVKHINAELTQLAYDYLPKGIRFLAINSNDVEHYPDDSPENMITTARTHEFPFPYLYDETQEVAKAYHAACTPDFFVFDKDLSLAYRGQLDDSRPGNTIPVTGESIRKALDCILADTPLEEVQKPSLGCNIKWKPC
ncbi:thioredoxin family protein [Legionella worsleiensis]|uniref:Putative thiol-disulfide isomerase n=1 Tax=Legionella worsleiensis TaxID=45076 RepID=A0A0W1A6R1_9GAMM|nr:thioredoxin family protein [Legionella worsleiensis]KTD76952.1 putative thiol-disulfide isomerase [Legionella worsleiensis]STY33377.1 putative thiol-disulfide isomerase and thioredoxins family [Legionella worsleiensis]